MRDRLGLLACIFLGTIVLLPGCRHAAGGQDRPGPMDPLREELLASTGVTDDDSDTLRRADRCSGYDRFWIEGMQRDEQTSMIYEFLGSSTACWKRVAESGVSNPAVQRWLESWAGFVSVQRGYVWAQLAVEDSNRFDACHRYRVASSTMEEKRLATADLSNGLSTPEARGMGNRLELAIRELGENLVRDQQRQRCDTE